MIVGRNRRSMRNMEFVKYGLRISRPTRSWCSATGNPVAMRPLSLSRPATRSHLSRFPILFFPSPTSLEVELSSHGAWLTCLTFDATLSDMKVYRLSARIDEATHRKLAERARIEVKDESEIIRDALTRYLDDKVESAYDAFMRAGGIGIADGPADLRTNKKYFEGFGRSDSTRSAGRRSARRPS